MEKATGGAAPSSLDAERVETPDSLFLQAKKMMAIADYKSACSAFERSYALEPKVTSLVNLANCRELNRELFTAWRLFSETVTELESAERKESVALRELARQRAESLAPRLSGIVVLLEGKLISDLVISVNDVPLSSKQFGVVLHRDGEEVEVSATAPGYHPWRRIVLLRDEGDVQLIEVPSLIPLSEVSPPPGRVTRGPGQRDGDRKAGFSGGLSLEAGVAFVSGSVDAVYAEPADYGYSFGKVSNRQVPAMGHRLALAISMRHTRIGIFELGVENESIDDSGVDGVVARQGEFSASVCECRALFSRRVVHGRYASPDLARGLRMHGGVSWQSVDIGFDGANVEYGYLGVFGGLGWQLSQKWSLWVDVSPLIYGNYKVAKGGGGSFVGWGQTGGVRYSLSPHGRGYYIELGIRENSFDVGERDAHTEVSARYLALGGATP